MTKKKSRVKNLGGRPEVKIDWSKVEMALSLGASKEITAGYIDVKEKTLEDKIRKKFGYGFRELRDRKMSSTRLKLIQKALSKAFDGDNTMLIFCLKNLCGWADKVEHGFDKDEKAIVLKYNLDDTRDVTPKSQSDGHSEN